MWTSQRTERRNSSGKDFYRNQGGAVRELIERPICIYCGKPMSRNTTARFCSQRCAAIWANDMVRMDERMTTKNSPERVEAYYANRRTPTRRGRS